MSRRRLSARGVWGLRRQEGTRWLFRHHEMEDGEQALRVGPDAGGFAETGGSGEVRETFQGVLVGKLGDDLLAVGEDKLPAADVDRLLTLADEMHLDPTFLFVVNGAVFPTRQIEVRAQLAIGPDEQVEIELGGDAGAVVIRRLQHRAAFLEVDADNQAA